VTAEPPHTQEGPFGAGMKDGREEHSKGRKAAASCSATMKD